MKLLIGLMWLLHWLPLPALGRLGESVGKLLFLLVPSRRHIALTNLRLCMPELSEFERRLIVRRHFELYARSVLERGILWWAPVSRLQRLIQVEQAPTPADLAQRPTVFLCPHFVFLEVAGVAITMAGPACSIYSQQRSQVFDRALRKGRLRFTDDERNLISRDAGIKPIIRAMREGRGFLMLPDMDFGPRESIFAPFFGMPAATLTAPARLIAATGGQLIPVLTHCLPNYRGWRVQFYPAWDDYPGEDVLAATYRMNAFIEARVREAPAEYFWSHKRFKTRPDGLPSVYDTAAE